MAQKARNPGAGRRQGFAIEVVSDANLDREHSPNSIFRQEPVDLVELLSARSGVAVATVRAHLAAFGMEARP